MGTDYRLLFELFRCTGIKYELDNRGSIKVSEWWWDQKLRTQSTGSSKTTTTEKSTTLTANSLEQVKTRRSML
ncbi:Hypothetical predicted protein [Olea europaea subsp. europaea]|uniref:Uncharacterized protein n=1 Tax=Olea europaea subsp. europaea TaxID=158383 RepID=A0A8S0V926_OLEEU|nr:Hypothetical predicted protein [Olea europaea subsp. europaea]